MKKLVALLPALLIVACATVPYEPYAREVKKKPREGGTIALKTEHRPEDRARADYLMSANCGTGASVNVAEEGEVVVGEKTSSSSNKHQQAARQESGFTIGGIAFASGDGRPAGENTNTESSTTQLKEWHIAYNCVADAAPAKTKKSVSKK
jgi:hypothetical protein